MKRFLVTSFWVLLAIIGVLIFGSLGSAIISTFIETDDQKIVDLDDSTIAQTAASNLRPDGELADAFSFFTDHTDIQRADLEKKIVGQTVDWRLPVYDVSERSAELIVVQTSATNNVGTFCYLRPKQESDRKKLSLLKEGDMIRCKGVVKGTIFRSIIIDPAISD